MKVFVAVKFDKEGGEDRISTIKSCLKERGQEPSFFVEKGEYTNKKEMMKDVVEEIKNSEALLADISEGAVGVSIEAGIAYALGKPVYVVHKEGSRISSTMRGISRNILEYKDARDIPLVLETGV